MLEQVKDSVSHTHTRDQMEECLAHLELPIARSGSGTGSMLHFIHEQYRPLRTELSTSLMEATAQISTVTVVVKLKM